MYGSGSMIKKPFTVVTTLKNRKTYGRACNLYFIKLLSKR